MTATTENPIDHDDRLQELLSNIGDVTSRKDYGNWRKEFLELYTEALDDNGILNGKDGNYRLIKQLQQLEHRTKLLIDGPIKNGSISDSTNGRRLLTNLTQEVARTETKVQELLPKTEADVEKYGFNKFELAAVLLEDAFYGYDKMKASRVTLDSIANVLVEESSSEFRSELQIVRKYADAVESFVRVMEDLKLITIMDQCVDVVYRGKERPPPKPPPKPASDDEEEFEEPSNGSDPAESARSKKSKKKKKKKDKATPATSDDDDDDDGNHDDGDGKKKKKKKKKEKSAKPSTKKKKKPKKSGDYDTTADDDTVDSADNDDDDDENAPKSKKKTAKRSSLSSKADKPKSSISKSKSKKAASSSDDENSDDSDGRNQPERDEEEESESSEEEEEEEEEEGQDGPPPESEFLLYFDPKTNSIGRIDRKEAIQKSEQLVETKGDDGHDGQENYKNVVTDQDEKDEIWFKLKKLERQKPEEESWLDQIKKEKAAAKGNNDADNKKKVNKSTAMISKRKGNNNMMSPIKAKNNNKGLGVGTTMIGSGGNYRSPLPGNSGKKADVEKMTFRNPLAEGGVGSPRKPANSRGKKAPLGSPVPKKSNEDYGAKYKQIADKPDTDGWSKVSSRALQ